MISDRDNRRAPLNRNVVLLIKGLIIGKTLTLIVVGGILWWLKPRFFVYDKAPVNQTEIATAFKESNFQTVNAVPAGSFKYGGSPAWAPIRQLVDAQIQHERPELQLQYIASPNESPSSSEGIRMLLDGQLDIAQSSRPVTEAEQALAQRRGFTLEQRAVGVDGIAVVVNPSLPVDRLTVAQLQQIYQGKIANWQQVGGPNLPIVAFSSRPEDADANILTRSDEAPLKFGADVKYVSSPTEALRQVSKTLGGVYFGFARAVIHQCSVKPLALGQTADRLVSPYREPLVTASKCPQQRNQLNTKAFKNGSYPITYNLYVIIKQNQGREQQVGEAYAQLLLSQQGQQALEQAGFTQAAVTTASQRSD